MHVTDKVYIFRFGDDEKLLVNNIRRVISDVLAYGPEGVLRLSQVNYWQLDVFDPIVLKIC